MTEQGEVSQAGGGTADRTAEWDELRRRYLAGQDTRPATTARGVHHVALLSSDVEATIAFYQGVLGFPLTELFENRDYPGSTHFFFDIGHGNFLAFFDFPGLDLGPYREVLGGHHHLAISVEPDIWSRLGQRLADEGVEVLARSGTSIYFSGPDGERIELIADSWWRPWPVRWPHFVMPNSLPWRRWPAALTLMRMPRWERFLPGSLAGT
jgi:catechol 2,3-dioxygenase-like lactoylglutathione lyase family enzyme